MKIPSWLSLLLDHWHVNVDDFTAFVNGLLAKTDLADSAAAAALADFLGRVGVAIQPGALLALATAAWLELKGGHPGYDPDAAGSA